MQVSVGWPTPTVSWGRVFVQVDYVCLVHSECSSHPDPVDEWAGFDAVFPRVDPLAVYAYHSRDS